MQSLTARPENNPLPKGRRNGAMLASRILQAMFAEVKLQRDIGSTGFCADGAALGRIALNMPS